jgi:hypothetical protein
MKKITVVGTDSAAKTAVIIALRSNFKVIDLRPEQIDIKNINSAGLVVYVDEEPDQHNIRRLNFNSRSLILQSQSRSLNLSDIQQRVFLQLANGLSDKANWEFLHLSRSEYFKNLRQLRMLFEVGKNWQLIQLAKVISFAKAS